MLSLIAILLIILAVIVLAAGLTIILGAGMIFINLKTKVPWVKIPNSNLNLISQEINLPPGSLFCDLGCGDGRVLFFIEKQELKKGQPLKLVGYELAFYPYLRGQFLKFWFASKVELKNKNFLKQDLGAAQGVFIFLVERIMPKVALALQSKLKPGALVISYAFKLPNWRIYKTLETKPSQTYIYLKN
ncbi:MAG: hypothetical protein NTX66_00915 [Candidatus Falkowbacteria bacterium]|nr:hypothetical protein [Candidatus Falkowbacteria bacterium]